MMFRKYRCPACGLRTGVAIIYGMPGPELFTAAQAGDVVLGGCDAEFGAPERQCTACEHAWRIKRRNLVLPDWDSNEDLKWLPGTGSNRRPTD